jgi:hypothetical protein
MTDKLLWCAKVETLAVVLYMTDKVLWCVKVETLAVVLYDRQTAVVC